MPHHTSSRKSKSRRSSRDSKRSSHSNDHKRYFYRRSKSPEPPPQRTSSSKTKRKSKPKNSQPIPSAPKSALWDLTPTEALNRTHFDTSDKAVVKMPDGTFADESSMANDKGAICRVDRLTPGCLKVSKDGLVLKNKAKRILIGNLNPATNSETLKSFLVAKLKEKNLDFKVDSAVVNPTHRTAYVGISDEKSARALLYMNGAELEGYNLSIQRLTTTAIANSALLAGSDDGLPPLMINIPPHVGGQSTGGGAISRHVADGPGKIFCAGLPPELGDAEVQELLSTYGNLDAFFLPQDPVTGLCRGFCFFKYEDLKVTNDAVRGLNGIIIGDNALTVKLHEAPNTGDPAEALRKAQQVLLASSKSEKMDNKSRVLAMANMVTLEDLNNPTEMKEILEDIRTECNTFGKVVDIKVPRPADKDATGVGKVFVKFSSTHEAKLAKDSLQGRSFGKNTVLVHFFSEKKFNKGKFGRNILQVGEKL